VLEIGAGPDGFTQRSIVSAVAWWAQISRMQLALNRRYGSEPFSSSVGVETLDICDLSVLPAASLMSSSRMGAVELRL